MKKILVMILLFGLMPFPNVIAAPDSADQIIHFSRSKDTVYALLEQITKKTGLFFIYDSKVINNARIASVPKGDYSVRQVIHLITADERLDIRVVGNHLLVTLPPEKKKEAEPPEMEKKQSTFIVLQGLVTDRAKGTPIDAGTVGVKNQPIGTITNASGEFRLVLPDSLATSQIVFSHLGYESQVLDASLLAGRRCTIGLNEKVISLQEVVIRIVNPLHLLRQMLERRKMNYASTPVYLTSFYREGVERRNCFVSLSEGVFRLFKTSIVRDPVLDQVKLLKMRVITNPEEKDTLTAKMKAGIDASLKLDVMKDLPDFLNLDNAGADEYDYASSGLTVVDGKVVNIVSFKQKDSNFDPLFCGNLYIDSENDALLRADFEINPRYITHATDMFVEKKSRHLNITPQKVAYTVTYRQWNGIHYISHVRGDLYFKIKKRRAWFGSIPLHTWFEMVTCRVDDRQPVTKFTHDEILPRRTVFADTDFAYDDNFWGNFNFIPAEEKLTEALGKIQLKIEETGF